jgi:hypothetical protein
MRGTTASIVAAATSAGGVTSFRVAAAATADSGKAEVEEVPGPGRFAPAKEADIEDAIALHTAIPPGEGATDGESGEVDDDDVGRVRPCMKVRTREGEAGPAPSVGGNGATNEGDEARTLATISFPLGVDGE